jgi:hypothetical protein
VNAALKRETGEFLVIWEVRPEAARGIGTRFVIHCGKNSQNGKTKLGVLIDARETAVIPLSEDSINDQLGRQRQLRRGCMIGRAGKNYP